MAGPILGADIYVYLDHSNRKKSETKIYDLFARGLNGPESVSIALHWLALSIIDFELC